MMCAWNDFLTILPPRLRTDIDKLGKDSLQELRLRINAPPELVLPEKSIWLRMPIHGDDLNYCVNAASRYSPWAAATISQGYITAAGGHRIGLCGEAVCKNGVITGIRSITSLCIRIARDFPGIAHKAKDLKGSVLILGAPGWGKTTLLRDFIRQCSDDGQHIAVVDERGELFPAAGFPAGKRTDILTGCGKSQGINMMLRTMGPSCIAVDEITEKTDCLAILDAFGCGVRLIATAHAASIIDFYSRTVYKPLRNVFTTALILQPDKSWRMERMTK